MRSLAPSSLNYRHVWRIVAVLLWVLPAAAYTHAFAQSPATSRPVPVLQEDAETRELAELVGMILDLRQTTEARRFFVRDLLGRRTPASSQAVADVLVQTRDAAVLEDVAEALFEVERPDPLWVEPLLELVRDFNGQVRASALLVLSNYHTPGASRALGAFVLDSQNLLPARLAAMRALAEVAEPPETVEALISALGDSQTRIRDEAHALLLAMGLPDFGNEREPWESWFVEHRDDSPVPRLRAMLKAKKDRLRTAERAQARTSRINLALRRDLYDRLGDAEKVSRLQEFLGDADPGVRILGMELINGMIVDRKDIPSEVIEPLNALISDRSPVVRARAVALLRDMREPAVIPLLKARLEEESDEQVLQELVNSLGRLGDVTLVSRLVPFLQRDYPPAVVGEAANSIGMLLAASGSGGTPDPNSERALAAAALLELFQSTPDTETRLREKILRAMSNVADPTFADSFVAHIDSTQLEMKLASIRGLAVLDDPSYLMTMVRHLPDPSVQVRQIAAQAVGKRGEKEEHLASLLDRLDPQTEPVESVRAAVWDSFVRVFHRQTPDVQMRWADRFDPATQRPASSPGRFVELLQDMERSLVSMADQQPLLGETRFRLSGTLADMNRHAEALRYYQQITEWLKAQSAERAYDLGTRIFRSQLLSGRIPGAVRHMAVLPAQSPDRDESSLRRVVREFSRQRLESERWEDVLELTGELSAPEGASLSESWRTELSGLEAEALAQRDLQDLAQVAEFLSLASTPSEPGDQARRRLVEMGPRAVPGLVQGLLAEIGRETHDAEREARLVELTKVIRPDWTGYDPVSPPEEKRAAVRKLLAEGGSQASANKPPP